MNHRSITTIIVAEALSVMRLKPRRASAKNAAIAANRIVLAVMSRTGCHEPNRLPICPDLGDEVFFG